MILLASEMFTTDEGELPFATDLIKTHGDGAMRWNSMTWLFLFLAACPVTVGCRRDDAASGSGAKTLQAGDSERCPHEIRKDKCPFCTPALVDAQGFCGEHGVAEALCHQCRPFLKTAFRAKGDWCKTHEAPDSQCVPCHPELRIQVNPGSGHGQAIAQVGAAPPAGACAHGIEPAKCPFCKPELIESDGFCKEHDLAEALCVKCRPYLLKAFKAAGDWCGEHNVPESQCVLCNPSLKDKKKTDTFGEKKP